MGHVWHYCNDENCVVCVGGLAQCDVCNGAEASLPTDCPGRPMTTREIDAVITGRMDYVRGGWDGELLPGSTGVV